MNNQFDIKDYKKHIEGLLLWIVICWMLYLIHSVYATSLYFPDWEEEVRKSWSIISSITLIIIAVISAIRIAKSD